MARCAVCCHCGRCGYGRASAMSVAPGYCVLCNTQNAPDAVTCANCGMFLPRQPGSPLKPPPRNARRP